MSKIIIDNRSDLKDDVVLDYIKEIIQSGRISNDNKQYCYLSTFTLNGDKYQIATDLNKASDRFVVIKEYWHNDQKPTESNNE